MNLEVAFKSYFWLGRIFLIEFIYFDDASKKVIEGRQVTTTLLSCLISIIYVYLIITSVPAGYFKSIHEWGGSELFLFVEHVLIFIILFMLIVITYRQQRARAELLNTIYDFEESTVFKARRKTLFQYGILSKVLIGVIIVAVVLLLLFYYFTGNVRKTTLLRCVFIIYLTYHINCALLVLPVIKEKNTILHEVLNNVKSNENICSACVTRDVSDINKLQLEKLCVLHTIAYADLMYRRVRQTLILYSNNIEIFNNIMIFLVIMEITCEFYMFLEFALMFRTSTWHLKLLMVFIVIFAFCVILLLYLQYLDKLLEENLRIGSTLHRTYLRCSDIEGIDDVVRPFSEDILQNKIVMQTYLGPLSSSLVPLIIHSSVIVTTILTFVSRHFTLLS